MSLGRRSVRLRHGSEGFLPKYIQKTTATITLCVSHVPSMTSRWMLEKFTNLSPCESTLYHHIHQQGVVRIHLGIEIIYNDHTQLFLNCQLCSFLWKTYFSSKLHIFWSLNLEGESRKQHPIGNQLPSHDKVLKPDSCPLLQGFPKYKITLPQKGRVQPRYQCRGMSGYSKNQL